MPRPSHVPRFDHRNNIWWSVKPLVMSSSPTSRPFLTLGPKCILLSALLYLLKVIFYGKWTKCLLSVRWQQLMDHCGWCRTCRSHF
jgi:hypothetical protein